MKKIFLITLAVVLIAVIALPSSGYCRGYYGGYRGHHHGNGWWIPGAILGGLFLGSVLSSAASPPVYYAPPPPPPPPPPPRYYYYYPPAPRVYVYPY